MALVKLRKASFVLVCLLIILLLWPGQAFLAGKGVQSEFAGGSGTEDDPYLIATAQQLAQVNNYLDACFKLIADINLDLAPYNRGKGWEPIGSGDEPFTGSFDGNGRIIRTLYINREDEDCIGLFGVTGLGSSLRSIKLEEVKIRGRNYVGGLVGLIYEGNIDDCYVSGTVRGEKDTGGLVGLASCIIRNCYTNCTVGGADNAGGIAGSNWGTLTGSYAAGQVTGREAVGGLVGCNEWFVEDTYVCGTVRGSEQVGGLVGFNNEGHIYNSYATGTVQGDRDTGGLVGFSDEKGIVFNSYYDRETTGQDDTGKGEPRTTAEMLHRSAYPKWDFATTWVIVDGTSYPLLRWQEEAPRLGFRTSLPRGSVQPGVEFQLELTDHKGESGALLTGSRMVTVHREGKEDFLFQSVVDVISGEARVPLTLSTPGSYTLRVYVEDVPYSELITVDVVNPEYAGGTGTVDDPYLIANARHLDNVRYNLNACYKLISDLDLAVAPYNEGDGWKPIGCQERPFTGFFDGNGKTIRGLYIMQEQGDEIGLFGYLGEGAALYNIQLAEVNVTGRTLVGGLVGYNEGGSIAAAGVTGTVAGFSDTGGLTGKNQGFIKDCYTNCKVDGRTVDIGGLVGDNYGEVVASGAAGAVTGTHSVGGLLGYHGGRAADCYVLGDVKGDLYAGGLAGIVDEQGTLINSYAAASVTGNHMAGGFVGANMGRVATCYATGDVTCEKGAGGFVGYNYLGEITSSYATGVVAGSDMIGGFVGLNEGAITASYAAGAVTGSVVTGGFAGANGGEGEIINSYYDRQTTGRSRADNQWGIPKTSAEMKQQATFTGWDFATIWKIKEGSTYPTLQWEEQSKGKAEIFTDLESVPWAKLPIEVLAGKDILKGISETEYAPLENITRADFLYSLVRTLGATTGFGENFADIQEDAYYYKEIGMAKELGITMGTGDNNFDPETGITRQDMMVLAERGLRLLNKLETQGTAAELDIFADKSQVADYAVDSIASLVEEGLILGSENKINPLENITRAEAAVFLFRIYMGY